MALQAVSVGSNPRFLCTTNLTREGLRPNVVELSCSHFDPMQYMIRFLTCSQIFIHGSPHLGMWCHHFIGCVCQQMLMKQSSRHDRESLPHRASKGRVRRDILPFADFVSLSKTKEHLCSRSARIEILHKYRAELSTVWRPT